MATQLLVGAPLAYMAAACYFTLARLGVFYFYRVVPGATGSHSLLMNAAQARPPRATLRLRVSGCEHHAHRAWVWCACMRCGCLRQVTHGRAGVLRSGGMPPAWSQYTGRLWANRYRASAPPLPPPGRTMRAAIRP